MRRNFDEYWYANEEFYKRDDLNVCYKDFKRHSGKWFRAACVKVHYDQTAKGAKLQEVYE